MSSKEVVVDMGGKPIRFVFQSGEGWVVNGSGWWWAGNPPVLHFGQGRGGGGRETPSVSRFEQGRGGVGQETLPSHVSGKGGVMVGGSPICLAFQTREGWWWAGDPAMVSC